MDIPTLKSRVEATGRRFPALPSAACLNPIQSPCTRMGERSGVRDRSAWALYNCRTGRVIAFFDTETFAPVKI